MRPGRFLPPHDREEERGLIPTKGGGLEEMAPHEEATSEREAEQTEWEGERVVPLWQPREKQIE